MSSALVIENEILYIYMSMDGADINTNGVHMPPNAQ